MKVYVMQLLHKLMDGLYVKSAASSAIALNFSIFTPLKKKLLNARRPAGTITHYHTYHN